MCGYVGSFLCFIPRQHMAHASDSSPMRPRSLGYALLLVSLQLCAAQFGGSSVQYTSGSKATTASINYAKQQLADALGGRPLRCAVINSLVNNGQLGIDGFAFLNSATGPAATAFLAAPPGEFVTPLNRSELNGALPWILDWVASQARVCAAGEFSASAAIIICLLWNDQHHFSPLCKLHMHCNLPGITFLCSSRAASPSSTLCSDYRPVCRTPLTRPSRCIPPPRMWITNSPQ